MERHEASTVTVRVGLPTPSGALIAAARHHRYSVLFSANAFAVRYRGGHEREGSFRGFRQPKAHVLAGLDAALDSAGFVAAVRYGDYPWTVEEYLDLVAAHPWRWWAAMDYCCEPEVARDRPLRLLRMAATVAQFFECRSLARKRSLADPIPVLQGYLAREYLESIDWLALDPWPALVGVGSVCRRAVHGAHGLLEVIETLDRALPAHVQLHLFGIKSDALAHLSRHPRIASTDSMAWDYAARRARPTARSSAFRAQCMERWMQRQASRLSRTPAPWQSSFVEVIQGALESEFEALVLEALALQHADLILSRDLTYLDALWSAKRDAATAIAWVRQRRVHPNDLADLDELIDGLAAQVRRLIATR